MSYFLFNIGPDNDSPLTSPDTTEQGPTDQFSQIMSEYTAHLTLYMQLSIMLIAEQLASATKSPSENRAPIIRAQMEVLNAKIRKSEEKIKQMSPEVINDINKKAESLESKKSSMPEPNERSTVDGSETTANEISDDILTNGESTNNEISDKIPCTNEVTANNKISHEMSSISGESQTNDISVEIPSTNAETITKEISSETTSINEESTISVISAETPHTNIETLDEVRSSCVESTSNKVKDDIPRTSCEAATNQISDEIDTR